MIDSVKLFCPLYEGDISKYDCDELRYGANTGYIPNDGIPPLLPIEVVRAKRQICLNCNRNSGSERDIVTQMVDSIAKKAEEAKTPTEKKRIEEQRNRLSGRAMEYLMFLDDEDE